MIARARRLASFALIALCSWSAGALAEPRDEQPGGSLLATDGGSEDSEAEDAEEASDAAEAPINPFSSIPPISVEGSLSRALSDPELSFCKDERADLRDDPLSCSISKLSARQRCPGLRRACVDKPSPAADSSRNSRFHGGLVALGDLTFWLVLAALLAALAFGLRRVFVAGRFAAPGALARTSPSRSEAASATPHVVETDVLRLWSLAEQSALAARFEEAVAALQAAFIHALRISGKLHVSPAQTNGDYLRALRAEPALHGTAHVVFRAVEAVQFGGAPASAELYRKLFERVQPVVVRVLSLLILCAFGLTQGACSKALAGDAEGGPQGLGVLTRLLNEQQTTVRRRIRALNVIEPEVTAILVLGEQPSEAWSKLLEFAAEGGTLIVGEASDELSKATNVRYESDSYQGRLQLPADFEPIQLELSAAARHALELGKAAEGDRTFALAEQRPYVAERSHGAGSVLFFADDDFLSNASLSVGDNAFFAVSLLRRQGRVLELVGPWTGGGASSTLSSLFKAGLAALVAQLALLAVLFGFHGGIAFGRRRDPTFVRRRAFRDHVLALGENYRRARATRFALATYGSWLIERLRERLSPQQPIGLIDLAGRIAGRVPQPESELVLLLAEARDAQDDMATARASPGDLDTLERLESLTARVGGSK
jgi:hypothetical protein